jgi:crotonobetainyl-CoA:carnitine CoA-transferase CaiB-like acyl-CoA transferase
MYKGRYAARAPYREIVEHFITSFSRRLTKLELMTEGQRRGIPIFATQNAEELVRCPQLAALDFFVEAEHPVAGKLKYPGAPCRIGEAPWRLRRAAPRLGEHSDEVYEGELGYSEERLSALKDAGAI